jgi:hypothetical protein
MTYPIFRRFTLSTIEVQASTTAPGGTLSGAERRGSPRVQVARAVRLKTTRSNSTPCSLIALKGIVDAYPGGAGSTSKATNA